MPHLCQNIILYVHDSNLQVCHLHSTRSTFSSIFGFLEFFGLRTDGHAAMHMQYSGRSDL